MKRFILTVAAVAFTVVLCGGTPNQADAKPGPKSSPSVKIVIGVGSVHSHHIYHGYSSWCTVRDYDGFTTRCYFPQYQCYGYFCPADGNWYFWCDSQARYLPISLLAQFPPTRIALTSPIAPLGVAPAGSASPITQGLPSGATAVPAPMGDLVQPK
jgi:hypothetical protein